MKQIGISWLRLLGLAFVFFLMAMIIYVPISIIGALLFLISPMLGTLAPLVAPFVIIWIVIYLSFSPPGITLNNRSIVSRPLKKAFNSVQSNLPACALYATAYAVVGNSCGLAADPAENGTWFTLFNILIHAFVNTGFVAAFFILYQDRAAVFVQIREAHLTTDTSETNIIPLLYWK